MVAARYSVVFTLAISLAGANELLRDVHNEYETSFVETMSKYDPIAPPGNEFVFDDPAVIKEETPLIKGWIKKLNSKSVSVYIYYISMSSYLHKHIWFW